jgi:WD40 repeat protein
VLTLKRKIEFALPVWAVALSEDGELAVGTSDGTVRLFHSLDTGEPFCMPLLHAEITAVSSLAFCRGQLVRRLWQSSWFPDPELHDRNFYTLLTNTPMYRMRVCASVNAWCPAVGCWLALG